MPVHWGTFDLGLHAWDHPIETLAIGAGAAGVPLITPRLGRPLEPSRIETIDPWWRGLPARNERTAKARALEQRSAARLDPSAAR